MLVQRRAHDVRDRAAPLDVVREHGAAQVEVAVAQPALLARLQRTETVSGHGRRYVRRDMKDTKAWTQETSPKTRSTGRKIVAACVCV